MLGKFSFIILKLFVVIIILLIVAIFYMKHFYIDTFNQRPIEISSLQIRNLQCSYVIDKNGIHFLYY